MIQYCLRSGAVAAILADVLPNDLTGRVDDEHCRSGGAIAQKIEHAVGRGDSVVRVSQNGEICSGDASHFFCVGLLLHGDGDDFGAASQKIPVPVLQIHDLLVAGASGLTAVENQHHVLFVSIILQRHNVASGGGQGEIGCRM